MNLTQPGDVNVHQVVGFFLLIRINFKRTNWLNKGIVGLLA